MKNYITKDIILNNYIEMLQLLEKYSYINIDQKNNFIISNNYLINNKSNFIIVSDTSNNLPNNFNNIIENFNKNSYFLFSQEFKSNQLKKLLHKHSFKHQKNLSGMLLDLSIDSRMNIDYKKNFIKITRLKTQENFIDWQNLICKCYDLSYNETNDFTNMIYSFSKFSKKFIHFIAYISSQPVATCSLFLDNHQTAGLYNAAATFVGSKYKAMFSLLAYAIKAAQEKGYKFLIAQANQQSKNTLSKRFSFTIKENYEMWTNC